MIPGFGDGPEDLVQDAISRLYDSDDTGVLWKASTRPTTDGVVAYLRKVIWHDFLDMKKAPRTNVVVTADTWEEEVEEDRGRSSSVLVLESEEPRADEGYELAIDRSKRDAALEWLASRWPDALIESYIRVQLDVHDGFQECKNQEAAERLGTSVTAIQNMKKRLHLRLRKLATQVHLTDCQHLKCDKLLLRLFLEATMRPSVMTMVESQDVADQQNDENEGDPGADIEVEPATG